MFQFFVENGQVRNKQAIIRGGDVDHIRKALRLKEGDRLRIVQKGDPTLYLCSIQKIGKDQVDCIVEETLLQEAELPCRVYLFQGLPKGDKMEMILQKAVELGAYEIIPVKCENAVVKLDDKRASSKTERWRTIAEAAAKQSKRRLIPDVHSIVSYREALEMMRQLDVKLMAYECLSTESLEDTKAVLGTIKPGDSVGILIGPEGGFSPEEAEAASAAGVHTITLGKRILRTETAGMMLLSWLVYLLEK